MVKIGKNNALGRGLRALIRVKSEEDQNAHKEELNSERHARNMEFYGSLLKKYVRSGAEDDLIEQMLEDVMKHMGISKTDHDNLLSTLRKRESTKLHSDADIEKVQSEIKEELLQLYERIGKKKRSKSRFAKIEGKKFQKDVPDAIPLPDKQVDKRSKVARIIKRRLVARDLDERAGIITGPRSTSKGKIQWMNEEEEPIKMAPPKEGLDDNQEPIISIPPKEGMEDSRDTLILGSSTVEKDEVEEVADIDSRLNDEGSGPTIEVPPSVVPAGPRPDLERKNEDIEEMIDDVPMGPIEIEEGGSSSDEQEKLPENEMESISPTEDEEQTMAEDDIEEIEELEEVERSRLTELEDSLLSMKILMEENKIDESYDMGERLLEKDPDDINILNEMGVILYHQGKMSEALALYRGILDREPDPVETLINYATLLSLNGKLDDSLECLDRAIRKDPYSEDGWNNKAVVLTRAGRLREALECLDEALRINEKTPSTWTNAGIILEKMGEIGPALECYQNLLEIDPENEIALQGIEYCRSKLE